MSNPTSYIAIDIETTGLDALADQILEIAWAPLDFYYQPLAPIRSVVTNGAIAGTPRIAENQYVRDMHMSSGLLLESLASTVTIEDAEREILSSNMGERFAGTPVIFGSSVHFDLRFIEARMPKLRKVLHYRVLDVTTLVAFGGAAGLPADESRAVAHRAADDIAWSINAAQRVLAHIQRSERKAA